MTRRLHTLPRSVSGAKQAASSVKETVSLIAAPRPAVAYAGPARSTNAGDRLLHRAYSHLLPGLALPALQSPATAAAAARLPRRAAPSAVLLGGGTLIGEVRWRRVLEAAQRGGLPLLPPLGVGVLDPRSVQFADVRLELTRWKPLLADLGPIPVRGPLSAQVLEELGLPAEVVGDPVLALPTPRPIAVADGLLGLNIGATRPTRTFGETSDLLRSYTSLAIDWQRRGGEVALFSVWPPDTSICQQVAVGLQRPPRMVVWKGDDSSFMAEVQRCQVLVAQKLHAAVLGVLAQRPVVIVEYQAKCRDLAASLELEASCIRMSEASPEALIALVSDALAAQPVLGPAVQAQRRRLVARLHACASRVSRYVAAPARPALGQS